MRTSQELLSAQAGTYIVNNTTTVTRTFHAIKVLEDTVFDILTDGAANAKGAYVAAPATAVKAGAFITPFDRQKPFASIKLTSGSVAIIL
jgi:hypothetical protein